MLVVLAVPPVLPVLVRGVLVPVVAVPVLVTVVIAAAAGVGVMANRW